MFDSVLMDTTDGLTWDTILDTEGRPFIYGIGVGIGVGVGVGVGINIGVGVAVAIGTIAVDVSMGT